MYQPAHDRFRVDDPAGYLSQLAAQVPATLVTLSSHGLVASILPMVFHPVEGSAGILRGHLARGNPQWRDLAADVDALVIFDGPDSYVTPGFYETKRLTGKDVPTWNYTTVQVRGPLAVRHEQREITGAFAGGALLALVVGAVISLLRTGRLP